MVNTILKYILSAVFLISAITKLIDFDATVELFQNLMGINLVIAKTVLSLLILVEILIAYLIFESYLQNKYIFYPIITLLAIFMAINVVFAIKGYSNCGCFGSKIVSSPLSSVIKNILIAVGVIYLKKLKSLQTKGS